MSVDKKRLLAETLAQRREAFQARCLANDPPLDWPSLWPRALHGIYEELAKGEDADLDWLEVVLEASGQGSEWLQ
jgi:hypothetical protein